MQLMQVKEPVIIAGDLRIARRLLGVRLKATIPNAETDDVKVLTACYCQVADLLLRICRVPLAPPGARSSGKLSAPLDITPEIEQSGEAEPHISSPSDAGIT